MTPKLCFQLGSALIPLQEVYKYVIDKACIPLQSLDDFYFVRTRHGAYGLHVPDLRTMGGMRCLKATKWMAICLGKRFHCEGRCARICSSAADRWHEREKASRFLRLNGTRCGGAGKVYEPWNGTFPWPELLEPVRRPGPKKKLRRRHHDHDAGNSSEAEEGAPAEEKKEEDGKKEEAAAEEGFPAAEAEA